MIKIGNLSGLTGARSAIRSQQMNPFQIAGMVDRTATGVPTNLALRTLIEQGGLGAEFGNPYVNAAARSYEASGYHPGQLAFTQRTQTLPERAMTEPDIMGPQPQQFAANYQPMQYIQPQQPEYQPIMPQSYYQQQPPPSPMANAPQPQPMQPTAAIAPKTFAAGYHPSMLNQPVSPNLSIQPTGRAIFI